MPLPNKIVIPKAWRLSGTRLQSFVLRPHEVTDKPIPPETSLTLTVWWPAMWKFFTVTGSARTADGNELWDVLTTDTERVRQLVSGLTDKRLVAAGEILGDPEIELTLQVNTEDSSYATLLDSIKAGTRTNAPVADKTKDSIVGEIWIEVSRRVAGAKGPTEERIQRKIRIEIRDAAQMQEFDGAVALDLGNTQSTLIYLNAGSHDAQQARMTRIINPEAHDGEPVPTSLLVYSRSTPPIPGEFAPCKYAIHTTHHQQQRQLQMAWEVPGAKRLLTDRTRKDFEIYLDHEVAAMPVEEPAELFVAEMFRGFQREQLRYPRPVAITCPTTFSSGDVERLKLAVYQGWRRARGGQRREPDIKDQERFDRGLAEFNGGVVIDEASAAAFYFICKDLIQGPGRAPALRYVYPDGVNVLLYDCGGGTTDISLVHVSDVGNGDFRIEVLGHSVSASLCRLQV